MSAEARRKGRRKIRILSHESFYLSDELRAELEDRIDAEVQVDATHGDAGRVFDYAYLNRNDLDADLIFGLDNISSDTARKSGILRPYASPNLDYVDEQWRIDKDNYVTPVDYGHVMLNYNKALLKKHQYAIPGRLEELIQPQFYNKVSLQNPYTSSPGQQFLVATIGYFGDGEEWEEFWKKLKANNPVSQGWDESYKLFARNDEENQAWFVNSYGTSPVAEALPPTRRGEPAETSRTGSLDIDKASYQQVETIAILRNTKQFELACKVVDAFLSEWFQCVAPYGMFVYPVRKTASLGDPKRLDLNDPRARTIKEFKNLACVPKNPTNLEAEQVRAHLDDWKRRWSSF